MSSLPRELLQRYLNPVFVETGTFAGLGVKLALELGFKRIHSVEIDPKRHEECAKKFGGRGRVRLHKGDTLEVLPSIVSDLRERATLWLDAHKCPEDKAPHSSPFPILSELAILAEKAARRDHVILIDDRRVFVDMFKISERQVFEAIWKVNPRYRIGYSDSRWHKLDIVVAVPE
jgi:hypothetical protein